MWVLQHQENQSWPETIWWAQLLLQDLALKFPVPISSLLWACYQHLCLHYSSQRQQWQQDMCHPAFWWLGRWGDCDPWARYCDQASPRRCFFLSLSQIHSL
jgi:hypothetical protein